MDRGSPTAQNMKCHARFEPGPSSTPTGEKNPTIRNHGVCNETNVQEINISHQTGKSSTQKCPFLGDMLVPWRVITSFCSNPGFFLWCRSFFHPILFRTFWGSPAARGLANVKNHILELNGLLSFKKDRRYMWRTKHTGSGSQQFPCRWHAWSTPPTPTKHSLLAETPHVADPSGVPGLVAIPLILYWAFWPRSVAFFANPSGKKNRNGPNDM